MSMFESFNYDVELCIILFYNNLDFSIRFISWYTDSLEQLDNQHAYKQVQKYKYNRCETKFEKNNPIKLERTHV